MNCKGCWYFRQLSETSKTCGEFCAYSIIAKRCRFGDAEHCTVRLEKPYKPDKTFHLNRVSA